MNGYKLVPVEPTQEMVEAARQHHEGEAYLPVSLYKAMLAAAPAVQGEHVGYIRRSAIELMEGDGLGVRANIVKEPRYPDCVALYTTLQPAEQQPCPEDVREGAPYDDPAFEALCREHEIWGTPAAAQCAVFWEAGKRVAEQQPELAKYQPCGCVVCTCEHETQCQGCGAHHCGTHPVGQIPGPVYQQPAPDVAELQAELERERKRRFDGNEQASREHREDVKALVEALEAIQKAATHKNIHTGIQAGTALGCIAAICDVALAAHRKQGGSND